MILFVKFMKDSDAVPFCYATDGGPKLDQAHLKLFEVVTKVETDTTATMPEVKARISKLLELMSSHETAEEHPDHVHLTGPILVIVLSLFVMCLLGHITGQHFKYFRRFQKMTEHAERTTKQFFRMQHWSSHIGGAIS
mmetsp:Transcript_141130/g.260035  ORF Transcript_141130/g.260035 Transcript_141130/m.260035 type:complete len:138 (+) Transcript_141130:1-414(+)